MPDYRILITKTAQRQLDKLPGSVADILIKEIKNYQSIHGRRGLKN